jgi:hypothetical protein
MILSLASRSDNVAQTTGGNFHRLSSGIVGRSLDQRQLLSFVRSTVKTLLHDGLGVACDTRFASASKLSPRELLHNLISCGKILTVPEVRVFSTATLCAK